jgi:hypothetical protein
MLLGGEIIGQIAGSDVQILRDLLGGGGAVTLFQKKGCGIADDIQSGGFDAPSRHEIPPFFLGVKIRNVPN